MPKLILLKGLPASGKSTFAKNYIKDHPGTIRINNDDLRKSLFGGNFNLKRDEKLVEITRVALVTNYMQMGLNLIIDNLNLHPKHEKFYSELCKTWNYEFEKILIDTPLNECLKRNKERSQEDRVPDKVIREWYRQYLYKEPFKLEQNKYLPHIIICDLDGTLALFGNKNPYDRDFENDAVNEPVRDLLVNILYSGRDSDEGSYSLIFVSGRKEKFKEQTKLFLERAGFVENLDYKLLMRKDDDNRSDDIIKKEIYEEFIKDKYYIEFVLDDRKRVKRMWVELGLFVLDCNQTDDEF